MWCKASFAVLSTYLIKNFQHIPGLLSDSSSHVPDDLNQLAVVLVQGGQESWFAVVILMNSALIFKIITAQANIITFYNTTVWCVRSCFDIKAQEMHFELVWLNFLAGFLCWSIAKKVTYLIHREQCRPSLFQFSHSRFLFHNFLSSQWNSLVHFVLCDCAIVSLLHFP